jgi:hypothetical protein
MWIGEVEAEIHPEKRFVGVALSSLRDDEITWEGHYNDCDRLSTKWVQFYGLTKIGTYLPYFAANAKTGRLVRRLSGIRGYAKKLRADFFGKRNFLCASSSRLPEIHMT